MNRADYLEIQSRIKRLWSVGKGEELRALACECSEKATEAEDSDTEEDWLSLHGQALSAWITAKEQA